MACSRAHADGVGSAGVSISVGIEAEVRELVTAGDVDDATTLALAHYGPELLGFLRAIARDDDVGAEAFALASEQLWRGLTAFRWEASVRTWLYQLGRNALHQLRRDPRRRLERNVPLSVMTSIEAVHRQPTAPYQRTESKQALRALRDALDEADHELLILRLDRGMSWKDIARATASEHDAPATLVTRAAALRKRYERVKAELRARAIASGLLADE